jgi:uncharacterized repeat protein (TIGR04138 family)
MQGAWAMSLRAELAGVLARNARYSLQAYEFIFEAVEFAKRNKRSQARPKSRARTAGSARHVTPRELCLGCRDLALHHYGPLAFQVLNQWGISSTSDLGEIVFNLIASGDLEKTPSDSRADFNNVFDFEAALRHYYVVVVNDPA